MLEACQQHTFKSMLTDFMYWLTWPRNWQESDTFFKASGPAQVWKINTVWEIKWQYYMKEVFTVEKQNKTVILGITNKLQVSKWWYSDLKIPVCFSLTQALFYNGDQKLSSLYCLGLLYYIWVISGRNINWNKSRRLVLQNKQTSHPQVKT